GSVLAGDGRRLGLGHLDALHLLGVLLGRNGLGLALGGGDFKIALGFDLAADGLRLELRHRHALFALRLLLALDAGGALAGDADGLLAHGDGLAGGAIANLLRHLHLRPFDRLRGGPLTDGLDVAGFIGDVADVDVDQFQANLVDLGGYVLMNQMHELLAIAVDLLDGERGDDEAKLAQDDVLRLIADLAVIEHEQTLRGVLHEDRFGGDADGEGGGDVDTDVVV